MKKSPSPLKIIVRTGVSLCFVLALAGCGGSADVPEPDAAVAAEPAATAVAEPTVGSARATASGPVVLRILVQPTGATVASGSGVSFAVSAAAATNGGTLRYQWRGPGGPIPGATSATYAIPAAAATESATIRLPYRPPGSITSSKVALNVINAGWAQAGGRALITSPASQQPSLALCGQPTAAWIETMSSGGSGHLPVWRFDGTAWLSLGGVLNHIFGASAAEPTLDCVDGQPVVAWTEGAGAARNVYVKRWNGLNWVIVSAPATAGNPLNQNSGSTASKPVLRVNTALPTTDPLRPTIGQLPQYSALAWIENGQVKAKFWNGADWQFYIGGSGPGGNGVTEIALTLDIEEPNLTSPPVIAMNAPVPASRRTVSASTNRGGWRAIGAAPSPLIPNGTALMLGGIGMGEDRVGRLPVTAWITGSVNYSIDSARFASADFTNGQLGLIAPTPAWSSYAPSFAVGTPKATSFDPREFRVTCGTDIVPSSRATRSAKALDSRCCVGNATTLRSAGRGSFREPPALRSMPCHCGWRLRAIRSSPVFSSLAVSTSFRSGAMRRDSNPSIGLSVSIERRIHRRSGHSSKDTEVVAISRWRSS